jgi:hypothetical protein
MLHGGILSKSTVRKNRRRKHRCWQSEEVWSIARTSDFRSAEVYVLMFAQEQCVQQHRLLAFCSIRATCQESDADMFILLSLSIEGGSVTRGSKCRGKKSDLLAIETQDRLPNTGLCNPNVFEPFTCKFYCCR